MVSGLLAGFFLAGRMTKQRIRTMDRLRVDHQQEEQLLSNRLGLNEEQRSKIRPIMEGHIKDQFEMRKRHRSEIDSARTEMFNELSQYLDEEQLNQMHSMRKEQERRRNRRRVHHRN